jgi:hypothetical protein
VPVASAPIGQPVRVTEEPTHAVLSTFAIDPSRGDEQDFGLRNVIVPGVRGAPGFVSGIWTRSEDGRTSVVIVSFTDASARKFEASVRANAEGQASVGLDLVDATLMTVSASATRA